MAKYQAEIRSMFVSVFQQDHFLHNVDMDSAIAMTLKQMGESYESMSADIDIGVANGMPVADQMRCLAVAMKIYIEV